MKLLCTSMVVLLTACTQAPMASSQSVVVSPLAKQLASCAIAAADSSTWQQGERLGRFHVNRSAALRLVAKDNPDFAPEVHEAIIDRIVNDRSVVFQPDFYASHCV